MDVRKFVQQVARDAASASRKLSRVTEIQKNKALLRMAEELELNVKFLLEENSRDVVKAKKYRHSASYVGSPDTKTGYN